MHNHVDHRWIKTFLVYFFSFLIIYTPTLVFAGAAEKWEIEEIFYEPNIKVMDVTARKTASSVANDPFYKSKVPVTSAAVGSTVASMVRMGLAGAAIYGAVEGVGWIIDNGVVKKPKEGQIPPQYWTWMPPWNKSFNPGVPQNDPKCNGINPTYAGALANVNYCAKTYAQFQSVECTMYNVNFFTCNARAPNSVTQMSIVKIDNPDAPTQPQYDPVPNDELGNQIIIAAPEVLPEVYSPSNPAGGPAPTSIIDSLEDAVPTPSTPPKGDTTNKPNEDTDADGSYDTYNPEKPNEGQEFSLPAFCEWAVVVCEWYVSYKQDSRKTDNHREKVEDWFDWTKEETEDQDTDNDPPEIEEIDIDALDTSTFTGVAGCPAPIVVPVSFGDGGETEISYEPICQLAEKWSFVAPLIGFLSGAMIIVGVGRKGEDGEI
jgi:hypothetical protein